MNIEEKYTFGQYMNISLKQVYQGSSQIDKSLLKNYLCLCAQTTSFYRPTFFEFCDYEINENQIFIFPQIFNEEKPKTDSNTVFLGDISSQLESYFNNFFQKSNYGTFLSLEQYNHQNGQHVIGGDPEYIEWCINSIKNFSVNELTKRTLELLPVYRLLGIKTKQIDSNVYIYNQLISTEYFQFK